MPPCGALTTSGPKVLVFEPSGALSASFGRKGRGPGELNYPLHLRVLEGDTIVVWDYMSGPIYHYDPSGQSPEGVAHRHGEAGRGNAVGRTIPWRVDARASSGWILPARTPAS